VIEVQNLTKRYGRFTAVDDVSFRVERGEIFGFLGPNGAGKTTTMRILTGYMPATDGKAVVAGFDIFDQPVEAKRRIGYLPETPPLYPDMTVAEYLSFVAKIKGVPSGDRKVRILDEPTAGLDPKQIIETRQLIKELAGDHTVILSTHILPEVSQTCERVVIINRGKVVAIDTPDNLTARLRGSETMYVQVDAAGNDAGRALASIPGVTRVVESDRRDGVVGYEVDSERGQDVRRDLARAVVSNGFGLLEMRPMRMSLEQVFLSLTTEESEEREAAEAPQEALAND